MTIQGSAAKLAAMPSTQRIFKSLTRLTSKTSKPLCTPMSWIVTVARNHCLDRLRSRKAALRREAAGSNDTAMLEVADAGPGPETLVEMKDEARRIADCLATLDTDRATAIRSAYLDGRSYDDIASTFGIPLNTLRSWLHRGLRKLKECMDA